MAKGKTIRLSENPNTGEWKITMNFAVPGEFVESVLSRAIRQHITTIASADPLTTLRLLHAGANKSHVIQTVRDYTNCGLAEAKSFVDDPPHQLSCGDHATAKALCDALNACGATARLGNM